MGSYNNKSKPPYLLGLLCLIPLVGAFVGLGLLLYGIIEYKDKWLSLIGAFGIVFTIAVYGSLFYFQGHSSMIKEMDIEFSQRNLNNLVKNIEFYKLQYGEYPDSLQQLTKDNDHVVIIDFIQGIKGRKNDSYNYKKTGNKYILFSSGEDGIPYTKDDFFPKIIIKDSSKIGLIKPNQISN